MQIRQLEYFLSLCDTLNFTRTAEAFFVSQTAVSQAIHALETELGTSLFLRSKKNVRLSSAGMVLKEDASVIVAQMKKAKTRVQIASSEYKGTLRIGYVDGYESEGLSEALRLFHERYPDVRLSFETNTADELWRLMQTDQVDLLLTILYQQVAEEYAAWSIKSYPLMAVFRADHPITARTSLYALDLKEYPYVTLTADSGTKDNRMAVERFFINAGFLPQVSFASRFPKTNLLAVSAGMGYTIVPGFIADAFTPEIGLKALPIIGYEEALNVCAVRKRDNDDPIVERFLEICLKTLRR